MTPKRAIHAKCLDCVLNQPREIAICPAIDCPLHVLRLGKKVIGTSFLKAIRKKCLDCSGFSKKDIRDCEHTDCSLYPYRLGKNPKRQGIGGHWVDNSQNS